jgi:hypothetical protein
MELLSPCGPRRRDGPASLGRGGPSSPLTPTHAHAPPMNHLAVTAPIVGKLGLDGREWQRWRLTCGAFQIRATDATPSLRPGARRNTRVGRRSAPLHCRRRVCTRESAFKHQYGRGHAPPTDYCRRRLSFESRAQLENNTTHETKDP